MTSTDNNSTKDHDESHQHGSEISSLLRNGPEVAGDYVPACSERSNIISLGLKRRIVILLCAFAFTMMLGDNLQSAALLQVFEDVICDEHYNNMPPVSSNSTLSPALWLDSADRCKVQPVQKELALVRGFLDLVPIFAALMCTVPYGLIAERVGRKIVLILSSAGLSAAYCWVLAVCYWRFASIRWVWLSGVFLFVGGGDAVVSSVLHVMVTDAVDHAERAQIFLFLHAAAVTSGFLGPVISAAMMERGYTWTVLLLSLAAILSGTFLVTSFIPETLNLRTKSSDHVDSTTSNFHTSLQATVSSSSSRCSISQIPTINTAKSIVVRVSNVLSPLHSVLTSNRQAVLLLCIFAPQTTARELFMMIGLQYSSAKFALPYGRGNILLSLFQGAQGLFVLVLLPLFTRFIADPRGWTAWARDRSYAISSIAVTASGLIVIAIAPAVTIEAIGLLLVALGSCTTGLLMSLLGSAVRPSQVSAIYSAALMLSVIARTLTAPVMAGLLVKGLELGWKWMGLPFAVMAVLMAGITIASAFIRAEKVEDLDQDEEWDSAGL